VIDVRLLGPSVGNVGAALGSVSVKSTWLLCGSEEEINEVRGGGRWCLFPS